MKPLPNRVAPLITFLAEILVAEAASDGTASDRVERSHPRRQNQRKNEKRLRLRLVHDHDSDADSQP